MYLLSRSELFRLIGMDPDKRLLIVGADDQFRRWIDVAIGGNTTVSEIVPEDGSFDVILSCLGPNDKVKEALQKVLSEEGAIWELVEDPGNASIWKPFDRTRVIVRSH